MALFVPTFASAKASVPATSEMVSPVTTVARVAVPVVLAVVVRSYAFDAPVSPETVKATAVIEPVSPVG